MTRQQRGGRSTGPRFEAIVALVIASIALLATTSGLPSITTTYEGETSFDGPGDQTVPIVVRLNEVAWQSAGLGWQPPESGPPSADLEVHHSSARAVRVAGPTTLSLADCGPSGDCDIPADINVSWRGEGPATVIWTVESRVYFNDGSIPDGASVGIIGSSPNRLPALVLLGAVLGILGAILAWGIRRRLRPRRDAVQAMDTGVLMAVAAVLALAGAALITGLAGIAQGPTAAGGGLLIGLAGLVVIGAWRRARDGGLLVLAVLGVATLLAAPSLLYVLVALPVYRPVVVVVMAALVTGATGLGLAVALANERSSPTGEPLTGTQRLVVILQAVLAGACVVAGAAVLGADMSIRRTVLGELIALGAAGLSVLALQRWLRGRTRLLTASWIIVSLLALLGLAAAIMLQLALLPEWKEPLPTAVGAVLSPPAIGALVLFGASVVVVRARRKAPVATRAGL